MMEQVSRSEGRPRSALQKVWSCVKKALAFLLVTILLIAVGLYGVMWVLVKGPSPTARRLFTLSVKETSAVGFLADLYLSKSEIAEIVGSEAKSAEDTTNTSLLNFSLPADAPDSSGTSESSSDTGIRIEEITSSTYKGYLMTVEDPTRLFVGTPGSYGKDTRGLTLSQMIEKENAVGGINAGGFYDAGGGGNGGIPDGIVICGGELVWGDAGTVCSVIGFDSAGVLHVGTMTAQAALDADIQWAVSFGPALIINGVPCGSLSSGVNPRTAIGQKADGSVLLLVIDGRQVDSLGATFEDLENILLDYGAVNASNLDGGSSTQMIYNGKTLNVCASVYGPRELATAILIK